MKLWPVTSELLRRLYSATEPIEAVVWDLPSFFDAYTLHDSSLIEVRLAQSDSLLVMVDWDMHWNKRVQPQYHRLVIGIPMVYSLQWSQGNFNLNTLIGATSECVSEEERRRMLEDGSIDLRAYQGAKDELGPPFEDEGLTRTTFESINGSQLTVLHGREVRLLCLDDEGRAGQIPCGDG